MTADTPTASSPDPLTFGPENPDPLTAETIEEAAGVIAPEFLNTPQVTDAALSRALGRETLVKVETLNPIRSFKGRGAEYYFSTLSGDSEVICASAGNFGQAIAYTGRTHGIPTRVFAATSANPAKIERMRALGAEVVLSGEDFDTAKLAARAYADEHPECHYVEDGRQPEIAAGAGTMGIELGGEKIDTLLVPVGNGALIAGLGCWFEQHSPDTKIVAVCPAGGPAMANSWRTRQPVNTDGVNTVADGLATRIAIPIAVAWMLKYVDEILMVDDKYIHDALRTVRDTLGLILEPAGAAGIAAITQHADSDVLAGDVLGTILTGSNYSPALLADLVR